MMALCRENTYERVQQDPLTKLALSSSSRTLARERSASEIASAKQQLQRLVHARQVLDPTGALERRLREAERKVARANAWHQHVQQYCRWLLPGAFLLSCVSLWNFQLETDDQDSRALRRHPHTMSAVCIMH